MVSADEPFTAPDITRAPANTSRGTGSPLMLLRSSVAEPDNSSPSTGTVSPGNTISTSPSRTCSTGTVSNRCAADAVANWPTRRKPSDASPASPAESRPTPGRLTTCAVRGAASISAVRLCSALAWAYSSMASPDVTISITAQLAQYSWTATVERIATTASRSTPTCPCRRSSIMPRTVSATMISTSAMMSHWPKPGSPSIAMSAACPQGCQSPSRARGIAAMTTTGSIGTSRQISRILVKNLMSALIIAPYARIRSRLRQAWPAQSALRSRLVNPPASMPGASHRSAPA